MATNKIQDGDILSLAPSGGAASGAPVYVNGIAAVALVTIASGAAGACARVGVFDLPVTAKGLDDENDAVAAGDILYYDGGTLNKDFTSGQPYGIAREAVGAGKTATIEVLLLPIQGLADRIANGEIVEVTWAGTVAVGDVVKFGDSMIGVALTAGGSSDAGYLQIRGVVDSVSVVGANKAGNTAVAFGDRLYLDTGAVNKDSTDGVAFAYALGAVDSGATTAISILLSPA